MAEDVVPNGVMSLLSQHALSAERSERRQFINLATPTGSLTPKAGWESKGSQVKSCATVCLWAEGHLVCFEDGSYLDRMASQCVLLQSALQDELHLRLDFLLVTCLRGNDYLPQLAFLADPVALGRETSRPILC